LYAAMIFLSIPWLYMTSADLSNIMRNAVLFLDA